MVTNVTERPLAECTDRELLARFASRAEDEAFSQLVQRHGPLILGVCRKLLVCEQDAEDVFQAAFLALARRAKQTAWHESISGWLYKVTFRGCLRMRAQNAARRTFELESETMIEDSQLEAVASQEEQEKLHAEVLALPRKYRDAIVLCCLEGLSREEAARELDCSVIDLKNRLQRGRQELLLRLGMRGVVLTVALASLTGTVTAAHAALSESLVATTTQAAVAHAAGHLSLQTYLPRHAAASKGALNAMLKTYLVRTLMFATVSTVALTAGIASVVGAAYGDQNPSAPLDTTAVEGERPPLVVEIAAPDDAPPVADPNVRTADDPSLSKSRKVAQAAQRDDTKSVEEKFRKILSQPTRIEFLETPLSDVVDFLKDLHHVPVAIDKKALEDEGVDTAYPITADLDGIKLDSALQIILEPLGLTTIVRHEVLWITTQVKAEGILETRSYDVSALLEKLQTNSQDLVDVVVATVAPVTWKAEGGLADIRGLGPLLVVRQSQAVHRELATFLEQLGHHDLTSSRQKSAVVRPTTTPPVGYPGSDAVRTPAP